MPSFSVSSRGLPPVEVNASNWIAALGEGLASFGLVASLERLACEVLPNGTVIARDVGSGTGFIVQQVLTEPALEEIDPITLIPLDEPEDLPMAIRDAHTPGSACSLALTMARARVAAESGAVILQQGGYLRFLSVVGPHSQRLIGVRLPEGSGIAGFSMAHKRVLVVDDAHNDARHCGDVDVLTGYTTSQIVVVPIVHESDCFGVIELMNPPQGQKFEPAAVKALEEVAAILGARLAD